jgi:hypothetical protein
LTNLWEDIFLPYIFLFLVLPTEKCGTGKYGPEPRKFPLNFPPVFLIV